MRRSGRSRKQREFFRPPEAIQELDSAEESEDDAMAPPKGKPSIVRANKIQPVTRVGPRMSLDSLATGATAARKKGVAKDAIFTYEGPRSKLFDAMLSGGTGLASEVRAIVSMFERNHISAISELINFVLLAGGARKKWIGNRVELDGLEPQEMEELLRDMVAAMTAAEGAVIAPLAALPSKKGVSIRDVYFDVWSQFVDSVNSPLSQGFKVGYTEGSNPAVEILEMLIGVLISLSSNGLASIRDAVTEAALDIGQCVLGISVAHRGKRDIAARQIKAEDQKNKSSKLTPKYKTLQKQVAECDEAMEEFTRLSLLIFDSIFAHRYKDFNSSIRANCTRRLGMWILGDPVTMYEDTYVKYLGWMCSDRSSAVRLESIKAISKLCDNATSVSLLESFLDRFVGRILEIAAADIDEDVALASISCLRKVQRFGALDEVEADTIGQVDAVVFEQSCSVEVRAEALLFMMEHTEGFEFLLTSTQNRMTPETATKRKKIGKKDTTPESIATLESRRNILLALETLTEFMDEFYQHGTAPQSDAEIDQGRLNGMADMLVKAFEALPKPMSSLLYEWDAMSVLLLKESDVFATGFALKDFQSAALLRLMIESAENLHRGVIGGDESALNSWSELQGMLQSNLGHLFSRFQDSESNLFALSRFLNILDLSHGSKALKFYLKLTSDLFMRCHEESLLYKLVSVWGNWQSTENSSVLASVYNVASNLRDTIAEARATIEAEVGTAMTAGNKKRKKSSGAAQLEDSLITFSLAANKVFVLLKSVNCSEVFDIKFLETLEAVANVSIEYLRDDCGKTPISISIVAAVLGVVRCLNGMHMWSFLTYTTCGGDSDKYAAAVDRETTTRDLLVEILQKCLDTGNFFEIEGHNISNHIVDEKLRELRRESFAIIGDLRVLFHREQVITWVPSQEMMSSMRQVFDSEVVQLTKQLSQCEDSADNSPKEFDKVSHVLIDTLLYPLETVQILDVNNLNRRQGAAVLSLLGESNEHIVETVKLYCKKLKEADSIKYLEVQMVALKSMFHDKVAIHLSELRKSDLPESQAEFSTQDILGLEADILKGSSYLNQFSQKVAQTFGIAKLKGETAKALALFFKVGIDFALSDPVHIGFLSCLDHYIRFLPTPLLAEVADYFQEIICSSSLNEDVAFLCEQDLAEIPEKVWYATGVKAYHSMNKALSKRSNLNRSNMNISEITRGSSVYGKSALSMKAMSLSKPGDRSQQSSESTSMVRSIGAHSHTKSYGSKRRRTDSISSNASSGLDDIFPSSDQVSSSTKAGIQSGMFDQRKFNSVSTSLFAERKRTVPIEKNNDIKSDVSGGRRSTRSNGSSKSYINQLSDIDEIEYAESGNGVAYGLHIEDNFGLVSQLNSQRSSKGAKTTRTSGASQGSKSAISRNSSRTSVNQDDPDSDSSDSIQKLPSTRNRNR